MSTGPVPSRSGARGSAIGAACGAVIIGVLNNGGNLLAINAFYLQIAIGVLPVAEYSEVRLTVQSATLYLDNTSNVACAANFPIPGGRATPMSGTPSEVVLTRSFRVETAADTAMRIALNSEGSIRATGGGSYAFQPVVTVLSVN